MVKKNLNRQREGLSSDTATEDVNESPTQENLGQESMALPHISSANENALSAEMLTNVDAPLSKKRVRGRPKGSKNRRLSLTTAMRMGSAGARTYASGHIRTPTTRKARCLGLDRLLDEVMPSQLNSSRFSEDQDTGRVRSQSVVSLGQDPDGIQDYVSQNVALDQRTNQWSPHAWTGNWNPQMGNFGSHFVPDACLTIQRISTFDKCVVCGSAGLDHLTASICSQRVCQRLFCARCISVAAIRPGNKVFDLRLRQCIVCLYQERRSPMKNPSHWHFDFKDEFDALFVRMVRDMLPMAYGLFIEVSKHRQPCWRRKQGDLRKHYSFKFYGGIFESRLEALHIHKESASADARRWRESRLADTPAVPTPSMLPPPPISPMSPPLISSMPSPPISSMPESLDVTDGLVFPQGMETTLLVFGLPIEEEEALSSFEVQCKKEVLNVPIFAANVLGLALLPDTSPLAGQFIDTSQFSQFSQISGLSPLPPSPPPYLNQHYSLGPFENNYHSVTLQEDPNALYAYTHDPSGDDLELSQKSSFTIPEFFDESPHEIFEKGLEFQDYPPRSNAGLVQ